jgi:hypothetical protein
MDDFAYFHGTDVAMLIPVALFMMFWACGIVAIDYWVSARRDLIAERPPKLRMTFAQRLRPELQWIDLRSRWRRRIRCAPSPARRFDAMRRDPDSDTPDPRGRAGGPQRGRQTPGGAR